MQDYKGLHSLKSAIRAEWFPEDPPLPLEQLVERWHNLPELMKEMCWAAWDRGSQRLVGFGQTNVYLTGDNEHLMEMELEVLPEVRRQGLGRELLRRIAGSARAAGRRLLQAETSDQVPAGAEFLARMGGRRAQEERLSELRIEDIDMRLIQRWLDQTRHLPDEFELGLWDGPVPVERLQDLADLFQVVANDTPRDDLEMEDQNYTVDNLQQFERLQLAGGRRRWILYAADRKSKKLVGMTEVVWNPSQPEILQQSFTGVWPDQRSKGTGRWLKAEMLTKVLRDRPSVKKIRTGNANSNAAMLKINVEMGFKPLIAWTLWQVPTESVEKYLASRG